MLSETGTVTLLFTDLVGSTELLDRLGDDAADHLRRDHFRLLREAVAEHGGQEVKSLGDGLMVAFPSVLAALRSAVGMQQRIASHNQRLSNEQLGLRIGVNAGEIINSENDYFGTPVVVAKRLCDRAEPGQTLVSDIARVLVGSRGEFRFSERGALSLKGFADPVTTFELDWSLDSEPVGVITEDQSVESVNQLDAEARLALPGALMVEARGEMVGRASELAELGDELHRTASGELRILLLAGEPGIGKTRLAAEFAGSAHDDDAEVLFGRSDPQPLLPFQPFVEALADYVSRAPDLRVRLEIGDNIAVLSRLIPELAQRFPEASASWQSGDPETDRYRLFDAVASLLRSLAERRPVVLVLDDLHWADKATLALLRQLVRTVSDARILILGTYRDVELTRDHPLKEMIAERHHGAPLVVVPMQGLSQSEVAALISAWAGQKAPDELAAAVWEETEGHPFFVQEVLRHLLETGAIHERRGKLTTADAVERMGIPVSVKEVIERRLVRLDEEVLEVLRLASVVGREFEVSLLEQVAESERGDRLLRLLDDATAAQLIGSVPAAFDRYRFSHALVRDVLYESLSPAWRVRLHQRTAQALEQVDANEGTHHMADLSRHYFAAAAGSEVFGKAIEYAIAAGYEASNHFAYEEASEHFERALHALELRQGDESRQCDVLIALGNSRWAAGEFVASRAAFARACALADRQGLADQLAAAALGFGGRIGFQINVVDEQMTALLERALELLDPGDSPLRARVSARLCEALIQTPSFERRAALAGDAVAMARRLNDKETLAEVLMRTWWGTGTPDNLEERFVTACEIVELASDLGQNSLLVEASLWHLGCSFLERGDTVEARDIWQRTEAQVAGSGESYMRWILSTYETCMAMLDRPAPELEDMVWRGLQVGRAEQNSSGITVFSAQLMYLRYLQGRLAEVHATAESFAEHFADVPAFRAGLASVCAEIGLAEEAQREFEWFARNEFRDLPRNLFWLSAMNVLSLTCAHLEDGERARVLYDLLAPFADRTIVIATIGCPTGCVHSYLGLLATVMERFDLAEEHFLAAFELDTQRGASHARLRASVDYADMLLRRDATGDRDRAEEIVVDTLDGARAAGLDGITRKLETIRRRLLGLEDIEVRGSGRGMRVISGTKAALSTRGRDAVARLVSGSPDDELQRRFGSAVAQRALFTALVQGFQPRMAHGFEGTIQVGLRAVGDEAGPVNWWTLRISGKRATVRHETAKDAAVTICTDVPTFMRLFTGKLNPVTGWLSGHLDIEGDVTLGPRMIELFGGVKPFEVGAVGPSENTSLT